MAGEPVEIGYCEAGAAEGTMRGLRRAPETNSGFTEDSCYRFACSEPGCSFFVDDEPLRAVSGVGGIWEWAPGFYAGEVTAEVRRADGTLAGTYLLDVSPDPAKFGRDVFAKIIQELMDEVPELLFGSEPATTIAGETGAFANPWLEYARLRRYVPQFMHALRPIQRRPRRALRTRRESAPLQRVRRVDRRTALSLSRSPAVVSAFAQTEPLHEIPHEARLDVPAVEETVDSAPNRAMLALSRALLRRTRAVHEKLRDSIVKERDSETKTSLAARWPVRRAWLEGVERQLSVALRRLPFDRVTRAETTAAGLNAISADPLYSRAWSRGWRALRHGVEGEHSDRLWVSPSWEIYERWCFLQLGKRLTADYPEWNWRLERSSTHVWVGRTEDRQAELSLQTTFRAYPKDKSALWSVSRERRPDMLLTVRDGGETRFVVVDAKYRVSRQRVLEAMESAHIYQDSLRVGSRRPEASLLVIPAGGGAPWLEEAAFQHEHRVGLFELSPGREVVLPEAIHAALELR